MSSTGVVDYMGTDMFEQRSYSEETAALVDREVRRLIDQGHSKAAEVLSEHRDQMEQLAKALCEKETLTGEEVARMLGAKPPKAARVIKLSPEGEPEGMVASPETGAKENPQPGPGPQPQAA